MKKIIIALYLISCLTLYGETLNLSNVTVIVSNPATGQQPATKAYVDSVSINQNLAQVASNNNSWAYQNQTNSGNIYFGDNQTISSIILGAGNTFTVYDDLVSAAFQSSASRRRLYGTNEVYISFVNGYIAATNILGTALTNGSTVAQAAYSATNWISTNAYGTIVWSNASAYLGIGGTAADSTLFSGQLPAYYRSVANITNSPTWPASGTPYVSKATNFLGSNGVYWTSLGTNYIITFP